MNSICGVYVVGIGPGDPEYLTTKAIKLIETADYVAGFKAAINIIKNLVKGKVIIIDYSNEREVLNLLALEEKKGKRCVICNYGDPDFSDKQFIEKIKSICGNVRILPGISSVQVSCARAGIYMEESIFITFHKSGSIDKEKDELLKIVKEGYRNAIVLPRPRDFMPKDVAKFLINNNVSKNINVIVYENLTLMNENVHVCKIGELLNEYRYSDLSILIIGKQVKNE